LTDPAHEIDAQDAQVEHRPLAVHLQLVAQRCRMRASSSSIERLVT